MSTYLKGLTCGENLFEAYPSTFNDLEPSELKSYIDKIIRPAVSIKTEAFFEGVFDAIRHHTINEDLLSEIFAT